jgi:hypothetical protein
METAGVRPMVNACSMPSEQVDAFIEGWAERARIMSRLPRRARSEAT